MDDLPAPALHLEVLDSVEGGRTRRVTRLSEDGARPIEIFHEFDRVLAGSAGRPLDGHVLSVLLYACARGTPLIVHGTLTRAALRHLEELQLAWRMWKPGRYRRIDIVPTGIVDGRGGDGPERAVATFSGGVDSTFTALRHTRLLPPATRYPLDTLLVVHGFDVDLFDDAGFAGLVARVAPLADDLGLGLRTLRTNIRDLRLQDWGDAHGLMIAGCLHMLAGEFRHGLISSSEPYDALSLADTPHEVINQGSSPVTDHLMSGGGFEIVHDGAGFSRIDKIREIALHPTALRTLKVCWAGTDAARNCGRCEKCVRTRLNFLAAGVAGTPPCFDEAFDLAWIDQAKAYSACQLAGLVTVSRHAAAQGIRADWLDALDRKIAHWQPADPQVLARIKYGGPVKRLAARTLDRLGLAEPAKRLWRPLRRRVISTWQKAST